jgi:two-component system, sensor histidine kinase RegB
MNRDYILAWYIRLRWFAFLGQSLVLAISVYGFKLTLAWPSIFALLCAIPISNLICLISPFSNYPEKKLVGSLLTLDTILLTFVLSLAGGPTNPFTIVYLLHVVIAAVLLTPKWTWAISLLSVICFTSLFYYTVDVPEWQHHGAHHGFSLHLHGMLFAYTTVALLVAYFLNQIIGDLQKKELKLQRLEIISQNQQKLTSLATVTANAAHELGSPLATIAVVCHELERSLLNAQENKDVIDDITLLKSEISRCKQIIQELSERTGDLSSEAPRWLTVKEICLNVIKQLKCHENVCIEDKDSCLINAPSKAITLIIKSILKNALEASIDSNNKINIKIENRNELTLISITDAGYGMDENTLEHIGEPFFTTKSNKGMGLGVYLSKLTLQQIGGTLTFDSKANIGTTAVISLPTNCLEARDAA